MGAVRELYLVLRPLEGLLWGGVTVSVAAAVQMSVEWELGSKLQRRWLVAR